MPATAAAVACRAGARGSERSQHKHSTGLPALSAAALNTSGGGLRATFTLLLTLVTLPLLLTLATLTLLATAGTSGFIILKGCRKGASGLVGWLAPGLNSSTPLSESERLLICTAGRPRE
jgi:hypothetical protein